MDEDNPQRLTVIVIAAWAGLFLVTGLFDPFLAYVARSAGYVFGAAILLAYYWKRFDSPWPWLAGAVILGALLLYLDYLSRRAVRADVRRAGWAVAEAETLAG